MGRGAGGSVGCDSPPLGPERPEGRAVTTRRQTAEVFTQVSRVIDEWLWSLERGKPLVVGPTGRLPEGMDWAALAALSPEEIRRRNMFPYKSLDCIQVSQWPSCKTSSISRPRPS
jgi:hypothetical protein